jgi:hypothetical protein
MIKVFTHPTKASDFLHRKKLASVGAANQVVVIVAKYTGTAPTASASGKLAARTVTQIKVLVCLNNCISLGVFLLKFEKPFVAFLETLSVAMTAANSTNPVVIFFRCTVRIQIFIIN